MSTLAAVYRPSLALLTDLYQLTMAYAYWKTGMSGREAAFHLTFREAPFGGGFTVACGLAVALEYLERFHFAPEDLQYLGSLRGADDQVLFEPGFLDFLGAMRLRCDVDAIPEGTLVFPHEPLVRVTGPIIQAQLLETPLLNLVNFQTLIATKAARVVLAARGEPVYEFGLRRSQGIDGGLSAARAAYVGGCAGTSNVLAGQVFKIPVRGTHAHSWVMCFESELESFRAYARAMPNNCLFLVDTYNTLQGVRNAVEAGRELKARGQRLLGIRLDSGDLAYLSIEARRILDGGGFPDAGIFASNDLDEHIITSLKDQQAKVNVWGVGTRLVTAQDDPSLGGVYKLTALRNDQGKWVGRVKLSEQQIKVSTPGVLQVRRFLDGDRAAGDAIYDVGDPIDDGCLIVDPADATRRKAIAPGTPGTDLLVPVLRSGQRVYTAPDLEQSRELLRRQLDLFHPGVKRLVNPHRYPAGLELRLHDRKTALILEARGFAR